MMSPQIKRAIDIFLEAGFDVDEFTVSTPNEKDIEGRDGKMEIRMKGYNIDSKYIEPKLPTLIRNDIIVTKVISEYYVPSYLFDLGNIGEGEYKLFNADKQAYITLEDLSL
jgi:hypothetical protein